MKPYIVKVDEDYREDHTLERIYVNLSITPVSATRCTQYDFTKLINSLIKQGHAEEEADDLIHKMMEEVVKELEMGDELKIMTEKHEWVSDDICLIEKTTGVKFYGTVCTDMEFLGKYMNDLINENEQLKQALLFYLDIVLTESLTDFDKWCNLLFNCNYEEAKRKYGDFEYKEWWESE